MEHLSIHNWDLWQSYRKDRGQPPWIKIHRRLLRNPEWVTLTDAERGQLVGIWLLAADHDGVIPSSGELIQKLCYMSKEPNLNKFIELGFIESNGIPLDAKLTPTRRQDVTPKAETDKRRIETDNGVIDAKVSHGSFQNVKLTNEELTKLQEKFGQQESNQRIEVLSEYMASKGKKYASHYATILAWARKEGWKDGNKSDGGVNDNLFLRTIREENERSTRGRMGGRSEPVQGSRCGEGGAQGNGGVPKDAYPDGRNSADGDKSNSR